MSRLDRGLEHRCCPDTTAEQPRRVRNLGADVAVGDWVVALDGERVEQVLPRRSAFVRRASFEGARAETDTLAANVDVVLLTHVLGPRRTDAASSGSWCWPSTAAPTRSSC